MNDEEDPFELVSQNEDDENSEGIEITSSDGLVVEGETLAEMASRVQSRLLLRPTPSPERFAGFDLTRYGPDRSINTWQNSTGINQNDRGILTVDDLREAGELLGDQGTVAVADTNAIPFNFDDMVNSISSVAYDEPDLTNDIQELKTKTEDLEKTNELLLHKIDDLERKMLRMEKILSVGMRRKFNIPKDDNHEL